MHSVRFPCGSTWQLNQGYGHGERIFDISFHPLNDDLVLTASEDSSVRLWQRPDGSTGYKQVRAYLGHSAEALRASWSSNGLLIASGSADRTVRLWAADPGDHGYTGRQLAVLDGHPEEVYHAEFVDPASPPRNLAAVRRAFARGGGGRVEVPELPLPPFETHVMVASSESIFIWSLQEGAVLQQANAPGTSGSTIAPEAFRSGARPAYIFGVARQPGGSFVATACCDGVVRLWSLRPTGHLEWAGQLSLPGQPMLTGCAFADDGSLLGVCSREGRLIELDVRTLEVLSSRVLPASPLTLAYLPAGSSGAAAVARTGVAVANDCTETCGQQQQQQQQQGPVWLVACRDGAVYGYAPWQQGGGSCWEVRPPGGTGVAVLALAVAPGGSAVALGGEPQDVSLLPPIHPQSSRTPAPTTTTTTAFSSSSTETRSGGIATSGARTQQQQQQQQPQTSCARTAPAAASGAVRAAVAAPARRRGARAGRVVVAGSVMATQGPMSALNEGQDGREKGGADVRDGKAGGGDGGDGGSANVDEQRPWMRGVEGGGDCVADTMMSDLAAMSLKEAGALAPPQSRSASGVRGEDVAMEGEEEETPDPSLPVHLPSAERHGQQRQPQRTSAGQVGHEADMETADGADSERAAENHRVLGYPAATATATAAPAVAAGTALSGRSRAPLFVYRAQ
ncbi:hypothetical protein VaNZ11_015876 [Volvox africanus]|uniref:Uncharacterized protein n=1 Tax=Volvox africanus TaxID=51714 RepID=A0ABQ5SM41_9CHLO|nr:hypothetical protein VaNZ11_015876 [Volvox africanus]